MRCLTVVSASFTSSHDLPFGKVKHPHVWRVTLAVLSKPQAPPNAEVLRDRLRLVLEEGLGPDLNASPLGDKATGEMMAWWVFEQFASDLAVRVVVQRDAEQLAAIVEVDG